MTRVPVLLGAIALFVVGCGRKAAVVAPELIHPKPPANLVATATRDGVQLRWSRPSQYTSGKRMRDLDGFIVERAQEQDGHLVFTEAATIHLEDRYRFQQERRMEWVDPGVTEGQRYLYRVIALTLDAYRSEPVGPVSIDYRRPAAKPSATDAKGTKSPRAPEPSPPAPPLP